MLLIINDTKLRQKKDRNAIILKCHMIHILIVNVFVFRNVVHRDVYNTTLPLMTSDKMTICSWTFIEILKTRSAKFDNKLSNISPR